MIDSIVEQADQAFVTKLASAETLGSITVICFDKTGTLTLNEPTVKKIILGNNTVPHISGTGFNLSGKIYKNKNVTERENKNNYLIEFEDKNQLLLFQTMILCNNAELHFDKTNWKIREDITEGALIVA